MPIGDGTGTRTASVTVKVYGTLVVVVSPRTTSVPEGQTVQLTAVVTGTTGISRVVQWETGNASRATVSATGVVSGLTAGTPVAIRARSIAVPGAVDSTAVTVLTRSVPTAISLTPRNDTLFPLGTRTLTASVLDQRGSVIAGAPVIWRSLTPAVARVSATGIVTADSQGVARILARTPTTIGTDSLSDTTTILIVAPCSLVRPIQFGTTYNGTFDVSSCRNYLGFTGALDQFSVTAAQQTYYSIRLTPSFVGSLVPLNVGAGLYGILPTDTTVQALGVIRPGTFGFMVASTTTAPGTYVVSTTLNPDARLSCVVTDVTRGVDFQTALTPNCQQRDIRILPALDPNGRITVTARSQSFPVRIELRAFSNNAVLGTSTATFTGGTATINYTTTTFRFVYVRVFGPPSANDYITITIDNQ